MNTKHTPLNIKNKANEILDHERKILSNQIKAVIETNGLEWLCAETGLAKTTIYRITTQCGNIKWYTICLIKSAVINGNLPIQINPNYEQDRGL